MAERITRHVLGLTLLLLALGWSGHAQATGLSEDALRARIESFVRARAGAGAIRVPSLRTFADASAAAGPVSVELSTRDGQSFRGSVPVTVSLVKEGRAIKRGVVTVQVRPTRRVVVAARKLGAGEVIEARDLRIASVPSSRLGRGSIDDPSRIVGQRARRSLREGTPLREDLVSDVPLVMRGEMVRIRLERGALRIDTLGKAREDGLEGRPMRVLNMQSRREIVGVVGADGVVHVSF